MAEDQRSGTRSRLTHPADKALSVGQGLMSLLIMPHVCPNDSTGTKPQIKKVAHLGHDDVEMANSDVFSK